MRAAPFGNSPNYNTADKGWKFVAGAFKIVSLGTGASSVTFSLSNLSLSPAFYFNPCLQYVSVSLGYSDADVMAYMRSLRGGWPSGAVQGDVSVLDHQLIKIAGGVRIRSTSASPSTGAGAVGDISYNTSPSVGNPKGWVCTVAGSPGTWVSMGNL
jgi:hypothetical protein